MLTENSYCFLIFLNKCKFLFDQINNLFRKGKIMKYIKSMTILLIAMSFAFAGCIHQESQNSDPLCNRY